MKLKSFGCSFVFGTDLPNDARYTSIATPSDHAWPALMASALDLPFECHARPSAGNFEISQRIINEIGRETGDVYIINWSWIDRFSYIDETQYDRHPLNPLGWASLTPAYTTDRAEFYYRSLHTQLRDKMASLTAIKVALDACLQTGTPFVMTASDDLIWETKWHAPPSVLWLQDQIRPYFSDFQGVSFLEWSRRQGFAVSETWHPLEQAHSAAADLWLPRLREIIDATRHRA